MGNERDPAAAAAASTTVANAPAVDPLAKDGSIFAKLVNDDHYKGMDPGTGEFLHIIRGDVVKLSAVKWAQVEKDFPGLFERASESDYKKAAADREKRAKDIERRQIERQKKLAARERERAIADEDEDDDATG